MKLSSFIGSAPAPCLQKLASPRPSGQNSEGLEPLGSKVAKESLPWLAVGALVVVLPSGRQGRLIKVDSGDEDFCYKVKFGDGCAPEADWFSKVAVRSASAETPEESHAGTNGKSSFSGPVGANAERLESKQPAEFTSNGSVGDGPGSAGFTGSSHGAIPTVMMRFASVPWYFWGGDGSLWWCLSLHAQQDAHWIDHHSLLTVIQERAPDLVPTVPDVSQEGLEQFRRTLQLAVLRKLLPRNDSTAERAEGLRADTLQGLLQKTFAAAPSVPPWEHGVVVEADGCMTFHPLMVERDHILWYCRDRGEPVLLGLADTELRVGTFCGAPALFLSTVSWEHILLADERQVVDRWALHIQQSAKQHVDVPRSWLGVPPCWETHRCVLNNARLCCLMSSSAASENPVTLSASLLREVLAAQGSADAVQIFGLKTSALRAVCLDGCTRQEIWSFWVNIYHCLLLHAREARGIPSGLRQVVHFYNTSSYIIAGHAFSLTEVEHHILRRLSSKPVLRPAVFLLRIRERSEEELERRPRLPAPFSPAGAYACRPDWRLNLVLCAGTLGSSDRVPIFERSNEESFDRLVDAAVERTLCVLGQNTNGVSIVSGSNVAVAPPASPAPVSVELPYTLFRYYGDAPGNMWDGLVSFSLAAV